MTTKIKELEEESDSEAVSVKGSVSGKQRLAAPDPEPPKPVVAQSPSDDRVTALEQEIAVLRDAMRKDRLQASDERIKGKKEELRKGFLKRLQGKVIVRWLGIKDPGSKAEMRIVYQNNMPVGEVMIGHYKTITGEDVVCEMREFTESTEQEFFEILGQDPKTGELTVRFLDPTLPQSFKILKKFINP